MRLSSSFVATGCRVPVMWVLAVNRQLAVNGGAMLVGCMVIYTVGLLTLSKTMDDNNNIVVVHLHCMALRPRHAPVVVFRGRWSSCAGRCLCCVWVPLLLGGHGRLLRGCRRFVAGVVCGGGVCLTWNEGGVLRWWWLWVEGRNKCHRL